MSKTASPGSSHIGGANPIESSNTAMNKPQSDSKIEKRSLDYVMRSGIAGGLAGCAVSFGYK
jgi:solute carrier family 25 protein 16